MTKREGPGSFGSLSSHSSDAVDIQSSACNSNSTSPAGNLRQCTTEATLSTEQPSVGRRPPSLSVSVSDARSPADATTPAVQRPTTATGSSHTQAKPKSRRQIRTIHRARAYEALTGTPYKPEKPCSLNDGCGRTQRHPDILRPGSTAPGSEAVSRKSRSVEQTGTRIRFGDWKPQKPPYVSPTCNWETQTDCGANSTSAAQRPQELNAYRQVSQRQYQQQQQQQQKSGLETTQSNQRSRRPRPPPLNIEDIPKTDNREDDAHSEFSNATYSYAPRAANPTSRSGVQSSRINTLMENYRRSGSYLRNQRLSTHTYLPFRYVAPSNSSSSQLERPLLSSSTNSSFSSMSTGRRMPTPNFQPLPSSYGSSQPSPSTISSSMYSSSPTPSRPLLARSPSPSWGAWVSDRPRATSPSFLDRARERVSGSVHSNLQKAGMRPRPGFEVHRVVKTPTEDIAAWSTRFTGPTRPPTAPGERVSVVSEGPGWGAMEGWGRGRGRGRRGAFAEGEIDYFGDGVENGSGRVVTASPQFTDISDLERRVSRYQQQQRELEEQEQQQRRKSSRDRTRAGSAHSHVTSNSGRNSLFLEGSNISSPASDTFFASEYSQQQVIRQAQEMVASLPASSPFHQGPFGANRSRDSIGADADFHVEPRQQPASAGSETSDDRGFLPSRSGANSVSSSPLATPILCESPKYIGPPKHRTLTRKKGSWNLR
ncbi:hypothetical protein GGS26DRAFT_599749 [Hypomontagnella submonticulosa]|nr:hypothetical protein GGS26DRAFT_599749 [Hypomontagnella submonticulosa]